MHPTVAGAALLGSAVLTLVLLPAGVQHRTPHNTAAVLPSGGTVAVRYIKGGRYGIRL